MEMISGAILVFAFLQTAATGDPMAEGMKALEANRFDAAAASFAQAVAKDPSDYAAHFHLALSDTMLKKDDEAIAEYRKTLELKPGLYEAQLNLGIVLVRDKKFADAATLLAEASAQKPKEFRPQYYLGEAILGTQDFAKAATVFEAAAGLDPKSAAAELGWAKALTGDKKLADAAPHFRKAAELDPKYRDVLLELAADYEKAGQPADAIEIYKQFPDNPGAQERMGALQIETKRYADAIPGLERAVAASPTSANRLALATAYGMNQQFDKELEQLQKVVALEPDNYQLHMRFGRALRDQKQLLMAENQFAAAAKLKPDSVETWNELAGIAIPLQDYQAGLAALDHVKALGKETPGDRFMRAITLDKLKQQNPAVAKAALAAYEAFLATSDGKFPDQEFQARQRVKALKRELGQR